MAVTETQIEEWKKEYGKIYKVTPVAGVDFIYKTLTREDYMEIVSKQFTVEDFDPEIETIKTCTLNDIDETLFDTMAGIVTVVYEEIMKKSGFVVVESEEL